MASGIIIIDKPQGWTSHDVVAKLRGKLHEKRIGHAGTLDPMATGVLPVFVGRATRAVEFAAEGQKEYLAGLRLGVVTDTQDITGTVLEERPVQVTEEQLSAVLRDFTGDVMQLPPMYSAIKKNGKKLYELARRGVEVEREPRPITIYGIAEEGVSTEGDILLRVRCSKGTYIRTLCHDIGAALGCGGTMASLRRTMACGFTLDDAVTLDAVLGHEHAEELLRPVDGCFAGSEAFTVPPELEKKLRNGVSVPCPGENGVYRVYGAEGEFLLLGRREDGVLTTIKSFYEV